MQVRDNPISKVGVFPYLGSEIPGAKEPNRIYYVYRPAEELSRPETIESFKLMPFIDEHEVLGVGGMAAERKGIQGTIGEQVYFEDPYLRGNLMIHSNAAQSLIKAGKVELSPCYGCDWVEGDGTYNGQAYQYTQRNLRGNHLALVEEGRTGPDVAVQDHMKFTLDSAELLPMLTEEMKQEIAAMIAEAVKAAMPPKDEDPKPEDPKPEDEDLGTEMPKDEDLAGFQKEDETNSAENVEEAVEKIEEAVEEVEEAAKDAEVAKDAKSKKLAADRMSKALAQLKTARAKHKSLTADSALKREVAGLKATVAKLTSAPAKDSGEDIYAKIADRNALAARVSQFTGNFDHERMNIDQVAKYACDKLSIKCAKGTESVALDAWLQGRKPEHETIVASDSKAVAGSAFTAWSKK